MKYFTFGSGPKTLVILPGLSVQSVMDSADVVADGYSLMENDFTVYVFDRRYELPPHYPVSEMAEDTFLAMRSLGLKDICLFGASQGGMMAMYIAAKHPEFIKKVVLASTSCRMTKERADNVKDWTEIAKEGDAEKLYLSFGEKLYPSDLFEQYKSVLTEMAKTVTDNDLARFVILADGTKGLDLTEELPKIKCPVYVTGSYDDAVLGPDASTEIIERLSHLPGLKSYIYENYGHAAYDTAPDFRQRVYDFFMGR